MTKNDFPGSIDELKVFPGNSDITSFEISNHNFLYQDKKVFSLKDLKKIDDNEMVLFLAFSNITRYIQDNNIGVKLIVDKEGGFLIEIPDELLQGFKEPINMNGYPIILSTGTASGDKEAFLNFMWKNVDIAKMYAS